jgi:hypothetical protein
MSDLVALTRSLSERFITGKRSGERHIAFWHDVTGEYESDLDQLKSELADVKVIKVEQDEFAVKYRLLHEEPEQSFQCRAFP